MNKSWLILTTGVLILFGFYYRYDSSFSDKQVVGIYVNKNFTKPICCVEAPHVPDTLTLNSDKSFYSKFYGHGNFTLDLGFWTTSIKLITSDFTLNTYFTKGNSGSPRIVLNYDMDHYYEKVQ